MSLIKCPECSHEISEKALQCIACGHPINQKPETKKTKATRPFTWVVLGVIIALGISYLTSNSFKENYRPKPPIEIKHRPALFSDSRVLSIKNLSNQELRVYATFFRKNNNEKKVVTIDIQPDSHTDFGQIEGWAFQSGDKILIKTDKYRAWEGSIP